MLKRFILSTVATLISHSTRRHPLTAEQVERGDFVNLEY